MSCQAMKRNNFTCILWNERSQSEKALFCMTPPMWQSRKGKTVERVKSGDQGLGWEKGCIDRGQRILRAVKILWYYNDGYMSLYACLFTKSCLTFCNPRDCGPTGSSVHGIFQARILEGVVILFSKPTDCTTPGVNLMESVDFRWWWCVSGGSPVVTHVPSSGGCWSWGDCGCVGQGVYGNSLYLTFKFAVSLKLLLKKSWLIFFIKKKSLSARMYTLPWE